MKDGLQAREHSIKPIDEPLQEYTRHLVGEKRDPNYISQHERRILRLLEAAGIKRLIDLDAPKIEAALSKLNTSRGFEKKQKPLSISTRNEYVTSICAFSSWARANHRIERDPLTALTKASETSDDAVHPRRGLLPEEVALLLDAALRRPEVELLTIRTGENKGKLEATVRERVLERARALGRRGYFAYLFIVWTGLRRMEALKLEWRDLFLDAEHPHVKLRAAATKARRGDLLPIHPQVVAELLAHRPDNVKPSDRVLINVPSMKVMKADLKFAGIEYGDIEVGYADLHAQRKTLNMLLAAAKVDPRTRQAQLRHTDPRLTEIT